MGLELEAALRASNLGISCLCVLAHRKGASWKTTFIIVKLNKAGPLRERCNTHCKFIAKACGEAKEKRKCELVSFMRTTMVQSQMRYRVPARMIRRLLPSHFIYCLGEKYDVS